MIFWTIERNECTNVAMSVNVVTLDVVRIQCFDKYDYKCVQLRYSCVQNVSIEIFWTLIFWEKIILVKSTYTISVWPRNLKCIFWTFSKSGDLVNLQKIVYLLYWWNSPKRPCKICLISIKPPINYKKFFQQIIYYELLEYNFVWPKVRVTWGKWKTIPICLHSMYITV